MFFYSFKSLALLAIWSQELILCIFIATCLKNRASHIILKSYIWSTSWCIAYSSRVFYFELVCWILGNRPMRVKVTFVCVVCIGKLAKVSLFCTILKLRGLRYVPTWLKKSLLAILFQHAWCLFSLEWRNKLLINWALSMLEVISQTCTTLFFNFFFLLLLTNIIRFFWYLMKAS